MSKPQDGKKSGVSREKSGESTFRLSYLPKDDIRRYPFQAPARGMAVSAFVFSLANLFSFGLFPPFSCLGVVCAVISYLKGNRQNVTYLAFTFGLIGLVLSLWITVKFGGYVADPSTFMKLFSDTSSAAASGMSSGAASVESVLSSAAA